MRYTRFFVLLPLALAPLAFAMSRTGCRQASGEGPLRAPPGEAWLTRAQVDTGNIATTDVAEHDVEGTLVTSGRIVFDDTHVAHVYSPVTGRVMSIEAGLGYHLEKGATLAILESPDLGTATSEYRKAAADLVQTTRNLERDKVLWAKRAISQVEYEEAEDAWRRAKAEYDRCAQKLSLLGVAPSTEVTQRYVLRAPTEGELLARLVSPNTEVQGQYGGGTATELFTIGDVDRLWAMADVYELDVARVHAGAHVEVTVPAYPGPFEGTVDLVAPMLDPATRTTKVRCVLDNPEARLKPEMYATIRVAVDPHRALTIPKSAILRLGDQTVVFVQKAPTVDGRIRFERKPVLVDEAPEGVAVVQHGLDAGELVVTRGAALLVGMI